MSSLVMPTSTPATASSITSERVDARLSSLASDDSAASVSSRGLNTSWCVRSEKNIAAA